MPLTFAEREACRQSRYLHDATEAFGTPAQGYCPIGAVAVARGTRFVLAEDGTYHAVESSRDPQGVLQYRVIPDSAILLQAEADVLAWTGHATLGDFLHALKTCGAAVFPAEEG